jgi:peroxiredoxin Q/BCP
MPKGILASLLSAAVPEVGTVVEDFEVTDTEGNVLVLSKMVATGPVVVAFFPKAFTPG